MHCSKNSNNGFLINNNQQALNNCKANGNFNGFNLNGNYHILLNSRATNNGTGTTAQLSALERLDPTEPINATQFGAGILINPASIECQIRNNTLIANSIGINAEPPSATNFPNKIYSNFANSDSFYNPLIGGGIRNYLGAIINAQSTYSFGTLSSIVNIYRLSGQS